MQLANELRKLLRRNVSHVVIGENLPIGSRLRWGRFGGVSRFRDRSINQLRPSETALGTKNGRRQLPKVKASDLHDSRLLVFRVSFQAITNASWRLHNPRQK